MIWAELYNMWDILHKNIDKLQTCVTCLECSLEGYYDDKPLQLLFIQYFYRYISHMYAWLNIVNLTIIYINIHFQSNEIDSVLLYL